MAYMDNEFNTRGKIPTESNFWDEAGDFVTSTGITPEFSRVIGEQVFKPVSSPSTPMYSRFASRPIRSGMGWTERALYRGTPIHFLGTKATAEDALKFYDSYGVEKTFTKNVNGSMPVSMPSEIESAEMMLDYGSIGELNSLIVDKCKIAYDQSIETDIQKKAISMTKSETTVDTSDVVGMFNTIADLATDFMGDDVHYNDLGNDDQGNAINDYIYTHADKVLCFVDAKYWNAYRNAKASLPSPSELVENCEIIPMYNQLPTPITTAEFEAGPRSGVTWDNKPVAIDKAKPIAFMCSDKRIEYRPYVGSYKFLTDTNIAGDFTSAFLHWSGCVAVKPWENAIRINAA